MKNDILIKEYEINENYHNTKQEQAWLVCALYLTFSIFVTSYILGYKNKTIVFNSSFIFFIIIYLTTILVLWFLNIQVKLKAKSVVKTRIFKIIFKLRYRINLQGKNNYPEIELEDLKKIYKKWGLIKTYRAEFPLYLSIWLFNMIMNMSVFYSKNIINNLHSFVIFCCLYLTFSFPHIVWICIYLDFDQIDYIDDFYK